MAVEPPFKKPQDISKDVINYDVAQIALTLAKLRKLAAALEQWHCLINTVINDAELLNDQMQLAKHFFDTLPPTINIIPTDMELATAQYIVARNKK